MPGSDAVIGRGRRQDSFVNLPEDRRVSRIHARVWSKSGRWWLEDLGSTNGTFLSDLNISGLGPVPLVPGSRILVGRSLLVFATDHWHCCAFDQVSLEFEFPGIVGLSLALAGVSPITDIVVRNNGATTTGELGFRVLIDGFGSSTGIKVPSLAIGKACAIGTPEFLWSLDDVGGPSRTGQVRAQFLAAGHKTPFAQREARVLAWDEWSPIPQHRCSIVPFVLPQHPLVISIVTLVRERITNEDFNPRHLSTLYEALAEYLKAPLPLDRQRQLSDSLALWQRGPRPFGVTDVSGVGTGIAALVAGCLENMGLNPVLAFILDKRSIRTLVGTKAFEKDEEGSESAPVANLIDPACASLEGGSRMTYEEARQAAVRLAIRYGIAFTVDVGACRNRGVQPLPVRWWANR